MEEVDAEMLARAWEAGWAAGDSDSYRSQQSQASSGHPLDAEDMTANPYRTAK